MLRILLFAAAIMMLSCAQIRAQDDDVSLGDLARAARHIKSSDDAKVIDNDNLGVVMEKAESERLNGKPVFSIDSSGKSFRMTSPDGTCSLSFDAKATALISAPYVASELPQDELLKLDGPAAIHDGVIEVSMHNGSEWELKEIVVAVTVPQSQSGAALKPALVASGYAPAQQKPSDLTMVYHLRGAAAPDFNTTFRGSLNADMDPGADWHWSLLSARGIPPAAPGSLTQPAASSPASLSENASPAPAYTGSSPQTYSGAHFDAPTPTSTAPPDGSSRH